MHRFIAIGFMLVGCGPPTLEGWYRVREVTADECDIRDDAIGETLVLRQFGNARATSEGTRYRLDGTYTWMGEYGRYVDCQAEGGEPIALGCSSSYDANDLFLAGSVFVEEGRLELVHIEPDCQSEMELSWFRGVSPSRDRGGAAIAYARMGPAALP